MIGSRFTDMPGARMRINVTMKLIDPALVEMPKKINPSRNTSMLIPGSVRMPAYGG